LRTKRLMENSIQLVSRIKENILKSDVKYFDFGEFSDLNQINSIKGKPTKIKEEIIKIAKKAENKNMFANSYFNEITKKVQQFGKIN